VSSTLKIRNWRKFQHYKDRCPPWIKLHAGLIDNRDWRELDDRIKTHLVAIWLLATRLHVDPKTDAAVPSDPKYLSALTGCSITDHSLETLINKGFLVDASNSLASCKQLATPETETETEAETETTYVGLAGAKHDAALPKIGDQVDLVWEAHLEARERYFRWKNGSNPPQLPSLTSKLKALIRQAIKEHGFQKATDAGKGIFWSDFHIGTNDREKEYLSPELCWRMTQQTDNVARFSELVATARQRQGRPVLSEVADAN